MSEDIAILRIWTQRVQVGFQIERFEYQLPEKRGFQTWESYTVYVRTYFTSRQFIYNWQQPVSE